MKFSEYSYQRPDFDSYQKEYLTWVKKLDTTDVTEAIQAMDHLNELRRQVDTAMNLASIRYSIDTKDAFYEAEDDWWNEYLPHFESLDFQFYQALLSAPTVAELREKYPKTLFLFAESRVKLFDEKLIPLFQKENQLASAYSKLVASAQIDFEGELRTIPQMTPFSQSTDRNVRKAAQLP